MSEDSGSGLIVCEVVEVRTSPWWRFWDRKYARVPTVDTMLSLHERRLAVLRAEKWPVVPNSWEEWDRETLGPFAPVRRERGCVTDCHHFPVCRSYLDASAERVSEAFRKRAEKDGTPPDAD